MCFDDLEISQKKEWYTQIQDDTEFPLKRTLKGLVRLSRFDEYAWFILVTSLLGVLAAQGTISWQLIILLFANWLSVAFAFMVNDIEDAPEDAFSTKNFERNPISSGLISARHAKLAALGSALISASLYLILGLWPFIIGIVCLLLGFLFSSQALRLKAMAFFDIITYGLVMAGLPFLCSYFAFSNRFNQVWFWPFVFVFSVRIFDRLHKEIRNIEGDRLSRLSEREAHQGTAVSLGNRTTSAFMMGLIILVVLTGVVTFFLINIVPRWVLIVMGILIILFMLPQLIKSQRFDVGRPFSLSFKEPLERAGALALILQFILPWLNDLLQLGIF